jgi:hypothetical protein
MAKEQEKGRNCKNNGMGEAAAATTKETRKKKGKSCRTKKREKLLIEELYTR